VASSTTLFDFTFNHVAKPYSSQYVEIRSGAQTASFSPRFLSNQPVPSKHRGLHFSGTQFLQVLPTDSLLLAPSFTIEIWIRPQGSGTIFAKNAGCVTIIALMILVSDSLVLATEFPGLIDRGFVEINVWTHIAITVSVAINSEASIAIIYENGLQSFSGIIPSIWDNHPTESIIVGAGLYKGFIWNMSLRNNLLSAEEIAGKMKSAG
jgi:hypothetical protein